MPAINPENYNIDSFNSQNLGPITVQDFRTYVLNHNLPGLDPLLQQNGISDYGLNIYAPLLFNPTETVNDLPNLSEVAFLPSPINDNTSPRPDNKKRNLWTNEKPFYGSSTEEESFEVTTKSLEDPGSIDSWVEEAGFSTDVFAVRNFNNLINNEYGPQFIETYNDPDQELESTGYIQYPTSSGSDILGPIIASNLGFSPQNFINFPSELQTVGTERRATELSNRIALNFVEDTVGTLNLDPLGLLAGESLFTPNYTITTRKGILGKAAQFLSNLTGFNYPKSIIPGGDQVVLGSNAFQEDLIDYTGRAQKKLLYKNVYSSKYSPELLTRGNDEDNLGQDSILGKIGDTFNPKKKGNNYLKLNAVQPGEEPQTFFGKLGQAINDAITPGDDSLIPLVDKQTNPNDPFVVMGTEGQYPAIDSLDPNSEFNNLELENPAYLIPGASTTDYYPNKTTLKPSLSDLDDPNGSFTHTTPGTNNLFYWQNRQQSIAKRGLLDFTQKMVNNAEVNGHTGGAKFIGRFDSNSNLIQADREISGGNVVGVPKHKEVSKGNLVRGGDNNDHYCRSWSTRNPYQNHYDLIRRDRLYRGGGKAKPDDIASGPFFGPYQSTLEDTGHVKVAPYPTDDNFIGSPVGGSSPTGFNSITNLGNEVKRYMFSIENLAWKDAPQKVGLENCEVGPNGGRIMWFPPYDISFTDNTTANWNTETFLGRAEPIYTYNSTERKGTLSWSIIVDHPSVLNKLKDRAESELYKFFAGCGLDISEFFEEEVADTIKQTIVEEVERILPPKEEEEPPPVIVPPPVPPDPPAPPVTELSFYFRNATSDYGVKGRKGSKVVGRTIEEELAVDYDTGVENTVSKTKSGDYLFLNKEWVENIDALIDFLATKEGQKYCVEFNGYCSALTSNNYNQILSIDRVTRVRDYVVKKIKELGESGGQSSLFTGTTSATTYVFDENNFKYADYGYKCKDGGPSGTNGSVQDALPESAYYKRELPNIDLTKCSEAVMKYSSVKYKNGLGVLNKNGVPSGVGYWWVAINNIDKPSDEVELSKAGRWIASANSEDYAADVDEDGDGIEDESSEGTVTTVQGASNINSEQAKRDRVVTLRVFKNHEYINNTQTAKNNPDKIPETENLPIDRLELQPITPLGALNSINKPEIYEIPNLFEPGKTIEIALDANGKPVVPPTLAGIDNPKPLSSEEQLYAEALAKTLARANQKANEVENTDIENAEEGEIGEVVIDRVEREIEVAIKRTVQKLFKECNYFEKIEKEDPFLYQTINEKIRHFHPAFHSITPEGLNSRLTFLQQCLRQGPSLRETSNQTQNMAFGKPPVLVLRIGDFYYTKIIPDSLNINYEPLVWDMNPEGIGVQPMIAKVDLNFSIIGGSSLDGPIRQLQNAVSFNFFANTSVYNPRRYYNQEKGKWQSLEERLEGEAKRIITSDQLIGFGAFKNQKDADSERYKPPSESDQIEGDKNNENQDIGIVSNYKIGEEIGQNAPPIPASYVEGTPPPIILTDSSGNTITVGEQLGIQPGLLLGEDLGPEVIGIGPEQSVFFGGGGLISLEDQQMVKNMYPGARTSTDDIQIYIKYNTETISLADYVPLFSEVTTISEYQEIGIDAYTMKITLTDEAIEKGTTIRVDDNFSVVTDVSNETVNNGGQYYQCSRTLPADNTYGPYPETQNNCTEVTIRIADFIYQYFREKEINATYRVKIPIFLQETKNPTELALAQAETIATGNLQPKLKEVDISQNVSFNLFDNLYELLA